MSDTFDPGKPVLFAHEMQLESFAVPYYDVIPAGSDLNAYREIGAYRCISGTVKKTLLNLPESFVKHVGFRLTVRQISTVKIAHTPLIQILEPNLPDVPVYRRYYSGEQTDTWGAWHCLATDDQLTKVHSRMDAMQKQLDAQEKKISALMKALKDLGGK